MSQAIILYTDFLASSTADQVQGMIYKGYGYPTGMVSSMTAGAIYLDNTTGTLWTATIANSVTGWKPFYSQITSNIAIDNDVQEGDLVGLLGAGIWTASGNLTTTRYNLAAAGSQNATIAVGGANLNNNPQITSELFNGVTWNSSGNLNTTRYNLAAAGSQNAGIAIAGFNGVSTAQITSELFNGSIWTLTGNLNVSRQGLTSAGTQNAGLAIGGENASSVVQLSTEFSNGTIWILTGNLNISRQKSGGGGSQNAGIIAAGQNASLTAQITSEISNGTTWILTGNLNTTRDSLGFSGSQNAGLAIGGENLAAIQLSSSEVFNGITWSVSGSLLNSIYDLSGAGSQNAGLAIGGLALVGGQSAATSLHNQTVYRRLNYTNLPEAYNIGVAINTSTTSLTANVMTGDVTNVRLPGNNFFGLSPYTQESTSIYLESATRAITKIVANGDGTCTVTLQTSNTNICNGLLIEIAGAATAGNNGAFPVLSSVGGTLITYRNPNGVNQNSVTGTGILRWANRLSGLISSGLFLSGNTATAVFSSVGGLTATQFQQLVRVGGVIYIPFASTSGASGSQYNYGTYRITAVGSFLVNMISLNSQAISEPSLVCTNIEYWAQGFVENSNIGPNYYRMGWNGKLRLTPKIYADDSSNYW